jgi:hypothetical protein
MISMRGKKMYDVRIKERRIKANFAQKNKYW